MDEIEELLTRGVDKIYPSKEALRKRLEKGKITLYQGFDPTGTQLHIGHMIGLRKLAQFQKLEHTVIFLIGTATGQAGDPSGKTTAREKFLSEEELRKNAKDYVMQAGKIVRFDGSNPIKITYNSDWFNNMRFSDLLLYFGNFTVQQLLKRDLFHERISSDEPLDLRAFLYPVLQGIDSFKMKYDDKDEYEINGVDLEIGGTDQTFNMLCGRQLVKIYCKGKEKSVMTTPLLTDASGNKIGKTEGNVIALNDKPEDLYGKIMSLSDDIIVKGLEYLTDVPMDEVKQIEQDINSGSTPMVHKKRLAFEIVSQLNNVSEAQKAQEKFERVVQKGELPIEIPTITLPSDFQIGMSLADALVELDLTSSKSEAKRLIEQGAVGIDNEVVTDPLSAFEPADNTVIRVGKRNWVRIKTSKSS